MRAALLKAYGPSTNLTIGETATPAIAADEILVRVHAAAINPIDWRIRSGNLKLFTGRTPPAVLGQDFAGVVAEVGKSVTAFHAGDRVYGMTPPLKGGTYAEYVKVRSPSLSPAPAGLSFEEAASLPLATLTAWQGLTRVAAMKSGESILVNGASGAVGIAAIQIARAAGCHVTAVCSARNADVVRSLGADDVIDYTSEPIAARPAPYDIFLDCAGTVPFKSAAETMRPGGRFVTTEPLLAIMLLAPLANLFRAKKAAVVAVAPNAADLAAITDLVEQGKLKPVIAETFPLDRIAQAHDLSETRRVVGKLVITI